MFYIMKRLQLRKTVVLDIMYYFGIIMILYAIDIVKVLKKVGIWMNMDMMKFIHLEPIDQIVAAIILDIDLKIFIQLKRRLKKIRKKKHIGQMQMLNKKKAKKKSRIN